MTTTRTLEANAVRLAAIGALVGFVLATAAVALIAMSRGEGRNGAVGLGLFVGVWGGAGFGAMVGAAVAAMRDHDWYT